jgi:uncharacterized membrane protein
VLHITVADVVEALGKGLRDFQALPSYGISLGVVYAIGRLVIIASITALGMSYLAYPFAAGFALIAPFVAAGFYELSRQRERGRPPSAREVWTAIKSHRELGWMAFVTIFMFIVWMYLAQFLMALFLGLHPPISTLQQFITMVLTTPEGLFFSLAGNVIGAALSLIVFSFTAVSFPLLLDRDDVDFVTAMITSVRAVTTSPVPMIGWGSDYCCSADRIGTNVLPRPANYIASTRAYDLASLPTHGVARVLTRHLATWLDQE